MQSDLEMLADLSRKNQTYFDDIVEGRELEVVRWSVTHDQVEGLIDSDREYEPWYCLAEGCEGVVPPLVTYPVVRAQIATGLNLRGYLARFSMELLRPIPYGCDLLISATITRKWIKRSRGYVEVTALGQFGGFDYFRTTRVHVLDYVRGAALTRTEEL